MTDKLPIISEREREILRLVAVGTTNQQIAAQLSISINTVKVHVRNIYEKIGVVSRPEATLYAVRAGIVPIELAPPAVQVALLDQPASAIDDEPIIDAPSELAAPLLIEPVAAAEAAAPALPAALADPTLAEPRSPAMVEPRPVARPRSAPSRTVLIGSGLIIVLLVGLVLALTQPWRGPAASPTAQPLPSTIALPAPDERWRELAPMPESRFGFALARFRFDGRSYLYAIGGEAGGQVDSSVLRYDLDANEWVKFSDKPTPVADVQAAVVGNRIFVPGGRGVDGQISSVLEAYDPQRDSWESLAPLPEPRANYALAAVEGKLYLFGGVDGSGKPRAEAWQYNPDLDTWQPQSALPGPRLGAGAGVIDGQIFLVGGEDAGGPLTQHQRYNPAEEGNGNPYTIRAPLPEPRSRMGLATIGGLLFIFGGSNQSSVLIYDSATDSWRTNSTSLTPNLSDLRADASDNKLYLFGGRVGSAESYRSYAYQALYQIIIDLGN